MKHLKTKLMASVAMLMVATVMLSSASFAWFTISTAPEVKGVTTQLSSNGNLEIALANVAVDGSGKFTYTLPAASTQDDDGKNITWGNSIDLSNYFSTDNSKIKKLRPVSFATASNAAPTVSAPEFAQDGRIKYVTALKPATAAVNSSDTNAGKVVEYKDESTSTAWSYRADFMLRTNTAGQIWLADTATDLGNGATGGGCFIKDKSTTDGVNTASYLKDIRVYAVVKKIDANGEAGDQVWEGTLLYNKSFNNAKLFDADANQIYVVQTYVLWDGANLTNADMAATNQNVALNIQFEHKSTSGGDNDLISLTPDTYKQQ